MGLETVEIVLEVEDQFGIKLSDESCSRVRTVGDLAELVAVAICEQRGPDAPVLGLETQVRILVARQLRLELSKVKPESRFVEDLDAG